jgi:hypothetical protein
MPGDWLTIPQFCDLLQICEATYHNWKRQGLGPEESWIGNTARISPDAMREWDERRREYQTTKAAKVEAERRRKLSSIAGKAAVASPSHPRHPSRRVEAVA